METLVVIVLVVILLGGGGYGSYSLRARGPGYSIGGIIVTIIIIWLVLHLLFRVI
jgi:hypothetical protein